MVGNSEFIIPIGKPLHKEPLAQPEVRIKDYIPTAQYVVGIQNIHTFSKPHGNALDLGKQPEAPSRKGADKKKLVGLEKSGTNLGSSSFSPGDR